MSSASFGSNSEEEFVEPDLRSLGDKSNELLEQVLNETLAATSSDSMSEDEVVALRRVVEQHQGQPLELDTSLTALVEAMVRMRFGQLSDSDNFWQTMSTWIARTLWEDPDSKQRIEALWRSLGEK